MSQLLQVATRNEFDGILVDIDNSVSPPEYVDQGIPFDSSPSGPTIAGNSAGPISHYYQGLPFTADGRLFVSIGQPVARIAPGGVPFAANGSVSFEVGGIIHHSAGIPYNQVSGIHSA